MRTGRGAAVVCLVLLGTACASSGPRPAPFPRPGMPPSWTPAPDAADPGAEAHPGSAGRIVRTALALQGAPYLTGGVAPGGFDCSGFTQYVFAQHGVRLPRTAAEQYRDGRPVNPDRLQPGDLVFFTTIAPGPSHVGLAIGEGQFVHAPTRGSHVRVDELDARYWRQRFLGVRRYVAAG